MRLLTAIAGILICLTGAFCFAVYTNPFSSVAFLVGIIMMAAGVLHVLAYLVSGRGNSRLTDTALVEGVVSFFYGFAVLNNQVTDNVLTMFFGTWLLVCGAIRIAQSFYISRFNPKDWAKILPLAAIALMLGIVMMMPVLLSAVMPLMLVGGALIVNGFSMLLYSMYMRRKDADKGRGEIEARQRAEAKKALEKAKREQRDQLRSASKQERDAAQAKIMAERKAYEEAKKAEKLARRAARRDAIAAQEATIPLTKEEVEEIVAAAPGEQLAEDAAAAAKAEEAASESPAEEAPKSALSEAESALEASMAEYESMREGKLPETTGELEAAARVSFKVAEDIPMISMDRIMPEGKPRKEAPEEQKIAAINLEEIESSPVVEFEKVELPKLDLSSMKGQNVNRDDVIQEIVSAKLPKLETVDYTPIDLDELVSETEDIPKDPIEEAKEAKRFTQVFNFNWVDLEEEKQ